MILFILCWAVIVFAFGVLAGMVYGVTIERRFQKQLADMRESCK